MTKQEWLDMDEMELKAIGKLKREQIMYERFTDRARKVMQLANQEAQRWNHEYIGTEHILLGLVKEETGVAANVLKNLDVDLRNIRLEVEKIVQSGPDVEMAGKLPLTPFAKRVIQFSIEWAQRLGHNYVGTEHLLLGLLNVTEGVASLVLVKLGLSCEQVKDGIVELLTGESKPLTPAEVERQINELTMAWQAVLIQVDGMKQMMQATFDVRIAELTRTRDELTAKEQVTEKQEDESWRDRPPML